MSEKFDFESLMHMSMDEIGNITRADLEQSRPDTAKLIDDLRAFWDKRRAAGDKTYGALEEALRTMGCFVGSCIDWKNADGAEQAAIAATNIFFDYVMAVGALAKRLKK